MYAKQVIATTILIAGPTVTLVLPLFQYVIVGWRARRNDIMDGFSADARCAYFRMFIQSEAQKNSQDCSKKFEDLYSRWYGRHNFVVPIILLTMIGGVAVALVVFTVLDLTKFYSNPFFALPAPAIGAISGAYLWVVNDHISRARRLDFAPSDVLWGVLRLVIAVPMGYAFASIANPNVGEFVAFSLGAFPLASIAGLSRRITTKILGSEATPDESRDDIINLQGVNKVIMERLANEDVTTVTQVAYCDPVRLAMRANLTFNFIIDLMNQALAWVYLENLLDVVRPLGMRGACEIRILISDFDNSQGRDGAETAAHGLAVEVLPLLADACKQRPETMQFTFRQIAADPFTTFLETIWSITDAGSEAHSETVEKLT